MQIAAVLVIAATIYTAIGILGGAALVERAFERGAAQAGREAEIENVRVNPFSWAVQLEGLRLTESATGMRLAVPSVGMDLSLLSLLQRRVVVTRLSVDAPTLRWQRQAGSPFAAVQSVLPESWRIEALEISRGEMSIAGTAGQLEIAGIEAHAAEVDRLADAAGRYELQASVGSATLDADGEANWSTGASTGSFTLTDFDLASAAPLLGPGARGLDLRGSLELGAGYTLSGGGDWALDVPRERGVLSNAAIEAAPGLVLASPQLWFGGRLARSAGVPVPFVDVAARFAGGGSGELSMTAPDAQGRPATTELRLLDLSADALAPLARWALGSGVAAGRAEIELAYESAAGRRNGQLRIAASDLELDLADAASYGDTPRVGVLDAEQLALAHALLEDRGGRLTAVVPFSTMPGGGPLSERLAATLRATLASLAAAPFDALGRLVGREGAEIDSAFFEPGAAELSQTEMDRLAVLAGALLQRPGVVLDVAGAYDPALDRYALGAQQIQLHVLLATAGPTFRARPEPVDFASPRAQDVLDEFANERLTPARLTALAADHPERQSEDPAAPARAAYYQAVFDALVENETITDGALTRLARFRAQAVADALASHDVMPERVRPREARAVESDGERIAIPLAAESVALALADTESETASDPESGP